MDVYMVAGSQAEKKTDNRIYVMKWGEMHRTTHEDEELSDSDEEEERNYYMTLDCMDTSGPCIHI